MASKNAGRWVAATREGSRRARLRRTLRMTVRERLEALDELNEASRALAKLSPKPGTGKSKKSAE